MKRFKSLVLLSASVTVFLILQVSNSFSAGLRGATHDFSNQGMGTDQICVFCHTPHNALTTVPGAPLWNHTLSTRTYQLYSSPTMQGVVGQPNGISKLCLSCHDGTVAIDSFGGRTGTNYMDGTYAVGFASQDLSNDHPISLVYDTALATADGELYDPSTRVVTIGGGPGTPATRTGPISQVMLYNNRIECSSCHDVHNIYVGGINYLKITRVGSRICFACHNK